MSTTRTINLISQDDKLLGMKLDIRDEIATLRLRISTSMNEAAYIDMDARELKRVGRIMVREGDKMAARKPTR